MYKVWLVVTFCVAALLLAVFSAPKLLPDALDLEVSITVRGSPETVFAKLATPGNWREWNSFVKSTEPTEFALSEPSSGAGASMTWLRTGRAEMLRIERVETNSAVFYELKQDGKALSAGAFRLTAEGDRTHVVWQHRGAFGDGYFQPIVLFFIEDRVAASMREGLEALRVAVDGA